MPDTTLPPVGATLSVVKESPLHGVCVLRHTQEGEARWGFLVDSVDPIGPIPIESNFTDHAALSLAWRSEQARQEAEATVAEWRHAAAFASLPGTGSPNLSEPREWGRQQVALAVILCDDLSRYKALAKAATERLARFESLAREAREAWDMAPDTREDAEYDILKQLRALAQEAK